MPTLYEEIVAKCPQELIDAKEHGLIAAIVSMGRTSPNTREVGNGTILEVLGFAVGNALLDLIYNEPSYRYVKPLLEQGRLIVSSNLVMGTLTQLIGVQIAAGVTFSQANFDAVAALGMSPAPVTVQDVAAALQQGA
jgi:hypothetical protein